MLEYNYSLPAMDFQTPLINWNDCVDMCKTAKFQGSYEFVIGYVLALAVLLSRRFIWDMIVLSGRPSSLALKIDNLLYKFSIGLMLLTTMLFFYMTTL